MTVADTFRQPIGPRLRVDAVHGYPLDLRSKAASATGTTGRIGMALRVPRIQEGLGAFERYLAGEGVAWLGLAQRVGHELVFSQQRGGAQEGGWLHADPCPHTYRVQPPWLSGMAQGEGASLLVRLAIHTGDRRFAAAARRALQPLRVPVGMGGVAAELDGRMLPQEYPTTPASHVLNGTIFALWGMHDVGLGLDDREAWAAFEDGVEALVTSLPRWDLGWWSRYDLFPHPRVNVASPAYHRLHGDQLEALGRMAWRPELRAAASTFQTYAASSANRGRALAAKVRFRSSVPRHPRLARMRGMGEPVA